MSKLWKSLFKDTQFLLTERVEVEWVDASGGIGWEPVGELLENCEGETCRSIGYIASMTPMALKLVSTQGAEDDINGWTLIPTPMIHQIIKLGTSGEKI